MKHEKELSTSAFPNVVPISKQLFSEQGQTGGGDQQLNLDGATMPPSNIDTTTSQTLNAPAATAAVSDPPSISHLEAAGQLSSLAKKGS